MNAPIDTLAFAQKFEEVGFATDQARALAVAFGQSRNSVREGLLTTSELDLRLSEFEARLNKQLGEMEVRLNKQLGEVEVRLTHYTGDVGKDVSGRLWSAVAIIGGVAAALSTAISVGVALLVKSGAL